MSVSGYFGPKRAEDLRLKEGDVAGAGDSEVLNGRFSVEEAQARAAQRVVRKGEKYGCVGNYDPVLRAHCRLDPARTQTTRGEG
jgi:hypothetical protein